MRVKEVSNSAGQDKMKREEGRREGGASNETEQYRIAARVWEEGKA
jgi:hypothetical protein